MTAAFERTQPAATVVAVGGYGRRELFPHSDVDLLLLTDSAPTPADRGPLSEFLRLLWDSGLRVSQSVHTVAECCEIHDGNLELTISLLDQRYLCGAQARHDTLARVFPRFLNAERTDIVRHLALMTRGRHAKYGNTIYHLEPNVKEHPGGLRDLHVIHWLGILRSLDTEDLGDQRAYLFSVRSKLHDHFRRDNNLLSFEAQELLSNQPENWMREYYRNARQIDRAVQRALERCEDLRSTLIGQFRDWRSRLSNTEFTVARGQVLLRNPALLETDAGLVMRLTYFIARHQLTLATDTERRLANARPLRQSWPELRELLSLPRCANALRAMADLGFLQRIIPEWSRIDCLVVRDFYHRYTVDEHTLVALEAIEDLAVTKDAARGHFAGLLTEIDRLDLLRLALLLHDAGKGEGAGDHALKSTQIASAVMDRLQLPEEDRQTVLFLIERHLDLSAIMTSRDLSETATARYIAGCTGAVERLKLLTLLTYADISAVNPAAMTPWRLEQLWKTYLVGHEEFTRELGSERIHPLPGDLSPQTAEVLNGLPTRYLKTHTPAQIAGHVQLLLHGNTLHLERLNETYRVTVAATDRPFLLASISGALASFGMNILKAEVFTNGRGQALDSFIFADPHRTLELNPDETGRLRDLVLRAISGKADVAKLIRKRPPVAKARLDPTVSLTNDVSETSTLIEIVAEDRPALLYDLTRTISSAGANIEVVLIDTEAHRALDVFYVKVDGGKLPEDQMRRLRERLLDVCKGR